LSHCAKSPIVSVVDLDRLGKGERLILLVVKQPPDVHLAAIAENLSDRLAGDQTFIAELAELRSSATRRGLGAGVLVKHVAAFRLAEAMVRSGEGKLDDPLTFIKNKRTERGCFSAKMYDDA
jgi:hypothetical protein